MSKLVLQVILIALNIANVFLHTFGGYLILEVQEEHLRTSQYVYLLNLSICEALMNFLESIRRITEVRTVSCLLVSRLCFI